MQSSTDLSKTLHVCLHATVGDFDWIQQKTKVFKNPEIVYVSSFSEVKEQTGCSQEDLDYIMDKSLSERMKFKIDHSCFVYVCPERF